jgi:cation transport ATPase
LRRFQRGFVDLPPEFWSAQAAVLHRAHWYLALSVLVDGRPCPLVISVASVLVSAQAQYSFRAAVIQVFKVARAMIELLQVESRVCY